MLVLTYSTYSSENDTDDEADRPAFVDLFEDADFRVLGAQDLSTGALREAPVTLKDAVKGGEVDRVVIVLSGYFMADARDSRLLGRDA
ncbi:hypothetical protein [Pseudogemmobacter sp. W21_MBD1_M6]|uniref:hypothetical protein n=1 Tax=Pseudogemmobacter sp. W21_MBD1_M6 TaxID=3240271 RepID=UPI003F9960F0